MISGKCENNTDCIKVDEYGVCIKCDNGYISNTLFPICIDDGKCVETDEEIGICSKCIENYTINYLGSCSENINCIDINKKGECIKCAENYTTNDKYECFMNPFCIEINENGTCINCKENYTISEYKCIENSYCNKTDENGTCIECKNNYSLDKYSQCVYIPHCLVKTNDLDECKICEENYTINVNENFNRECVYNPHCEDIYDNGYCAKCEKGWALNSHMCEYDPLCLERDWLFNSCKKCINNYTVISKECVYDPYCIKIDNDGKCIECKEGSNTKLPKL